MDIWGGCNPSENCSTSSHGEHHTSVHIVNPENEHHEHEHEHEHNHIQNIEIKITDSTINLPDAETTTYDFLQYTKNIITPNNIIFLYKNVQVGIMYHHRFQNIIFHKSNLTWII
jgi:hypothetical protein